MIKMSKEEIITYNYKLKIEKDEFFEFIKISSNKNVNNLKDLWEIISNNVSGVRKEENRLLFYYDNGNGILSFWFELPKFKNINDCQIENKEAKEFTKSLFEFIEN